jgi:putative glutamine amidotransferase
MLRFNLRKGSTDPVKRPIIGVTTYNDKTVQGYPAVILLRAYVNAIINANGTPVLIPTGLPEEALCELFPRLDGLLFTGGGDISIEHFSGQDHSSISNVDTDRDTLELSLMEAAIDQEKPFLGICRGFQLMNVVLGGSLYTDIASQKMNSIKHDYYPGIPRDYLAHTVEITSGSRLANILSSHNVEVNSLHHQGLLHLANGIEAVGLAPDGLVEAVELPGYRFGMAVQWHPEWLTGNVSMARLFSAFIDAARYNIQS